VNAIYNRLRGVSNAAGRSDDSGFSIIEVMAAMVVFAVISVGIAACLTAGLLLTNTSRSREVAINLASQDIDHMRMLALGTPAGVFSVTSLPSPVTYTVGGATFTLKRSVNWVTTTGGSGSCGTGSGTLAYKSVVDKVTWKQNHNTMSTSMTTLVAPISNINSDTAGTIIVSIIGASGAAVSGVAISITPNSGGGGATLAQQPSATDSDGCSFGLNAQPGTYTVKATETNGIDYQQHAPASNTSVVVTAGQNTMVNFTYDLAGTFAFTYPSGATLPTNMPLTFINDVGGASIFATPSSPTSVSAFPYTDGYQIVAGTYVYAVGGGPSTCIDSNPQTWPTDPNSGAAPPDVSLTTMQANPGAASVPATLAVPMGVVKVSGISSTTYVTAVSTPGPSGTPDPGCLSVQTLTFPKSTSSSQTIALPYGTWTIYSGTSSGAKTTNVIKTNASNVSVVTTGSVDGTTTYTVMMDPRVTS
jgi:prepilin-type N-terminal cleavage/methylation domain-containing protein